MFNMKEDSSEFKLEESTMDDRSFVLNWYKERLSYSDIDIDMKLLYDFYVYFNKKAIQEAISYMKIYKIQTGKEAHYCVGDYVFSFIGKRQNNETIEEMIENIKNGRDKWLV